MSPRGYPRRINTLACSVTLKTSRILACCNATYFFIPLGATLSTSRSSPHKVLSTNKIQPCPLFSLALARPPHRSRPSSCLRKFDPGKQQFHCEIPPPPPAPQGSHLAGPRRVRETATIGHSIFSTRLLPTFVIIFASHPPFTPSRHTHTHTQTQPLGTRCTTLSCFRSTTSLHVLESCGCSCFYPLPSVLLQSISLLQAPDLITTHPTATGLRAPDHGRRRCEQ